MMSWGMAKEDEQQAVGDAAGRDAAAQAFAPGEAPPKKSRRLLIVIAAAVLLLAGAGAGAYLFFFGGTKEEEKAEAKAPPPKPSIYFTLPGMIVNMDSGGGRSNFLKVTVSLELDSDADVSRIQKMTPRIVDGMQGFLRTLRPEDVRGANALARMRGELLDRVNRAVAPSEVKDVMLLEALIQ